MYRLCEKYENKYFRFIKLLKPYQKFWKRNLVFVSFRRVKSIYPWSWKLKRNWQQFHLEEAPFRPHPSNHNTKHFFSLFTLMQTNSWKFTIIEIEIRFLLISLGRENFSSYWRTKLRVESWLFKMMNQTNCFLVDNKFIFSCLDLNHNLFSGFVFGILPWDEIGGISTRRWQWKVCHNRIEITRWVMLGATTFQERNKEHTHVSTVWGFGVDTTTLTFGICPEKKLSALVSIPS